jgi:hypothetical protein
VDLPLTADEFQMLGDLMGRLGATLVVKETKTS